MWTGCSDDDEGTTTPTLTQGDTLDPTFVAFREGVGATDEVTSMMLSVIFSVADSVISDTNNPYAKFMGTPVSLGTEADSFLVTYHEASQYWYAYLSNGGVQDTAIVVDSIQFLHSTGPVQWPDSALMTGLKSGMSFY